MAKALEVSLRAQENESTWHIVREQEKGHACNDRHERIKASVGRAAGEIEPPPNLTV